jgi:septum formation protein
MMNNAIHLTTPLILASQSPRRSALLTEAGIAFEAVNPRYEEPATSGFHPNPAAFAESISLNKAASLVADYPDRIILAADTVVAVGNEIFGKPADIDDARRILGTLLGTTQQVITGVTLLHPNDNRQLSRHDVTHVTMRRMSPQELDDYLAGGDWEGKAGAYGIQGEADKFVERCEGSFTNVVGLPMELVRDMLREFTRPTSL